MDNSTHSKQILIDVYNYNTLKELGKTGYSFNNVVHNLLNNSTIENQTSSNDIHIDNIVEIHTDDKSFILKIYSGLQKEGVNGIIDSNDDLEFEFLNENNVSVFYPKD